ncbi:hypothetical protein GC176_17240 [bacterium]|nr:hypothetical protein [bacterium]
MLTRINVFAVLMIANQVVPVFGSDVSHPPMLPLPEASASLLPETPRYFVDAAHGEDANDGSQAKPWRTVNHGLRQLSPGDTLCLRGGTYYEHVDVPVSGAEGQPITVCSYPGELVVIDGGLREFFAQPETAWQPFEGGAPDEFVSTKTYPEFAERPIVSAFPAAGWEPFYGKEDDRPLVLGHFGDSMVPLHGYRTVNDLRDDSMLWDIDSKFEDQGGVYCGPGLWFDRKTMRIHIRLAPTNLAGLGEHAYHGETDPRKLRLCISGPYGADVLRLNGVQHVIVRDLVLRGAGGSALINLYGSEQITFDGLTVFGGSPGLLAKASHGIRMVHCAFRGLAAPWSSRASMKYRGTPSYLLITQRNQPQNEDWEITNCEFTDSHDGLWLRYVRNLKFHHNLVDNCNDDGLEFGARKRNQLIYVYQNLVSRCLLTLTLHEMEKDESPPDVDPGSGIYLCRNVFDLRRGPFSRTPKEPDPTGAYLNGATMLAGDHGGPTWPNYFFYQNTVLRSDPSWRGYYGFGIGGKATRWTQRRVFNNIFAQIDGLPDLNFASADDDLVCDGNLHWSFKAGPEFPADRNFFEVQGRGFAFRKTPRPSGWLQHDQFVDPRFLNFAPEPAASFDVRLSNDSPSINAGVPIPDDWLDPLRDSDVGAPDIGAFPLNAQQLSVGVRGRIRLGKPSDSRSR